MVLLHLSDCSEVTRLELEGLAAVTELDVRKCSGLRSMNVAGLASLKLLHVWACDQLASVEGLEDLAALERVQADEKTIQALDSLTGLPGVKVDVFSRLKVGTLGIVRVLSVCHFTNTCLLYKT